MKLFILLFLILVHLIILSGPILALIVGLMNIREDIEEGLKHLLKKIFSPKQETDPIDSIGSTFKQYLTSSFTIVVYPICIFLYFLFLPFFVLCYALIGFGEALGFEGLGALLEELGQMALIRIKALARWGEPHKIKQESKVWVKTSYGDLAPSKKLKLLKTDLVKGRPSQAAKVSKELKRFASIVAFITNTQHLNPWYKMFFSRVERMILVNGLNYTFKYLKEAFRLLTKALSGDPVSAKLNKSGIKLDKYGMPTIFPLAMREEIRRYIDQCNNPDTPSHNPYTVHELHHGFVMKNSEPYVQAHVVGVMSIAAIFRVLKTNVKPSVSTIIGPFTGTFQTYSNNILVSALRNLHQPQRHGGRYDIAKGVFVPKYIEFPPIRISIGSFHPVMSAKAGPNGPLATFHAGLDALAFMHHMKSIPPLLRWMFAQKAFVWIIWFLLILTLVGIPYISYYWWHRFFGYVFFSFLPALLAQVFSNLISKDEEHGPTTSGYWYYLFKRIFPYHDTLRIEWKSGLDPRAIGELGRLTSVYDQAGKARVIAITNWWIQSALFGLHSSIFRQLGMLPTDGTFDQASAFERFLSKLDKSHKMSGFDLSAATDRLPIQLQADILSAAGIDGNLWKSLLDFEWWTPSDFEGVGAIKYAVGQPMGAYSSWAMLALTHHVILYIACVRSEVDFKTLNYAVLGDDMVVNNDIVANQYILVMGELGVSISMGKSVISNRFTEFAKRLQGPGVDFSPIGPGAVLAACRSGYMFPALFRASWGNVFKTFDDILEAVKRVPSGLVARRDLMKFIQLVLWQFSHVPNRVQLSPSMLVGNDFPIEHVSGITGLSGAIIATQFADSISNLLMRQFRQTMKDSHLPIMALFTMLFTKEQTSSITTKLFELLLALLNPGFWLYLYHALTGPTYAWEKLDAFFENIPAALGDRRDSIEKMRYYLTQWPNNSVCEIPLSKKEGQLAQRFLADVLKDMQRRNSVSKAFPLNIKWYELEGYTPSYWHDPGLLPKFPKGV